MKRNILLTLLLGLFLFSLKASCPDSTVQSFSTKKPAGPKGWEFVGNFGAYWGNKYQASFYNGSSGNENNIKYVLGNQYWHDEIKNLLMTSVNRDSFALSELPSNMKYSATMHVGFGVRYNFNPEWAFNLEFNFAKLTAKDFFTLEVFPAQDNESHSYVQYPIWGIETRTNIQAGVVRTLNTDQKIRPFFELGTVITNTLVKESKISIEDQPYNLVNIYSGNYVPNSNTQEYEIKQGGIGFGGYVDGGVKIMFNDFVSMELYASLYYQQINLKGYNAFKPQGSAMFRLVLSPAFFMAKSE
jgi:hypothetical protein